MEVRGPPNNDLERAKLLYSKTVELEKQLRNELKKKSPLDKNITQLRNSIRDNYEQVLFLNYEFAMSKEVEQNIWKSVFYRVIEEYRKRLRKPHQQNDDEMKRTGAAFRQFLTSAMSFYQRLLCKLQATFHLTLDGSVSYRLQDDGLAKLHRSYVSCHRCFIFMGDIARYHKDIKPDISDTTPPVWARAAEYYQNALMILPDNGNPHNQLAVLATYEDDSFSGVYRYFRSLAVRQPFTTARDNLKAQFEKNRLKLEMEEIKQMDENRLDLFLARFVRLQGIFFNKTELDLIATLKANLLRSFSSLLASNTGPQIVVENMTILKLISMLIFTVHNVVLPRDLPTTPPLPGPPKSGHAAHGASSPATNGNHHAQQPPSPEDLQLQLLAVTVSFEFVAALMRAICALRVIEPFDVARTSAYLGCVGVFLEWLRVHPEFVPRTPLPAVSLWDNLAQVLNSIATMNLDTSKSVPLPSFLEAEAELRGFLPLHNYIKTLPQSLLVRDPAQAMRSAPNDGEAWSALVFRVRKLREFGTFACGLLPQVVFYNKDTGMYSSQNYKPNSLSLGGPRVHNPLPAPSLALPPPPSQTAMHDDNASVEDNSMDEDEDDDENASFPAAKFEFVEEDDDPLFFEQPKALDDDDFEDEVILYRPDQLSLHGSSQSNSSLRSNSPSPAPSPAPSPSLSSVAHSSHAQYVQTRGAEFGIIGSRPKTPPHESPTRENVNPPPTTSLPSPTSPPQPEPAKSSSFFYSNFDFASSFSGLNHPFSLSDSPAAPLSSLFNGAPRYSLFSADASAPAAVAPTLSSLSPSLPQVIDMPFQNASVTPPPLSQTAQSPASENGAHSPTCTNRDSPFAWLPISLSHNIPSPSSPIFANNEISVSSGPYLDSAILSADSPGSLPFPFPGEPTLKFRTKNPFVNT